MNILRVVAYYKPAYGYGGPVHSIHSHSLALAKKGHRITTYTTNANGQVDLEIPAEQPALVDGLPVFYFPRWWFGRKKKPSNLFFSPALGRALKGIKAGDFDLLLLHASFCDPARMAAGASRRINLPYIYYTHGGFEPWALRHKHWKKQIYFSLIENRIINRAAGVVVCNNSEEENLQRLGIKTQICRIPWGVELPNPEDWPGCSRLYELWPALRNRPYILFLSRLHPKKGLDLLIPAFASLAKAFPDWLLVLAGPDEGGYQVRLEGEVRSLSLENRVIFTGMVAGEAKRALLAHADLFVLPSYSEGFPVAVAEALGYGRPLVITDTCYVPEVEREGAGLVVKPQAADLTTALQEMLRDNNLRHTCSAKALQLARKQFTWEAVARKSLDFYREVMA